MSKRQPTPCAPWVELVAQAGFGQLSAEARAALQAHLTVCPACAAVHTTYLQTAALLHQMPDPEPLPGLPPQLLEEWAARGQHAPAHALARTPPLQEVFMRTSDEQTPSFHPPMPPTWRERAGRRMAAVMSAVAAVLVIALVLAALVVSHLPGKPSSTGTSPGTSASVSDWQALPHLAQVSGDTFLAPSDPRVVYQLNATQGTLVALRRSDDQGATWKSLPAPTGATPTSVTSLSLFISPTNAEHVLAIIGSECPASQAAQAAGAGPLITRSNGQTCSTLYVSTTGGERWAPVTWPSQGSTHLFLSEGIHAQDNRLYAILTVVPGYTASELVESLDDGATWQVTDQGMQTEQHCLVSVVAPRTGTTLFATTLSTCGTQLTGASAQLWRSEDAGATWTPVSSFSGIGAPSAALSLMAVNVSGQTQPVLIDQAPVGDPRSSTGLHFSLDSGKTWQSIPALAGQGLANNGILGVLGDGSIVEQTQTGLYAWKAGDSTWHQVAPALAGAAVGPLVTSNANGKEALYIAVPAAGGNTESFYRVTL